jgi:cystathionine gamma-synthase
MAAASTLIQALEPGAHVLVTQDAYHGTLSLMDAAAARWGLSFTPVDTCDLEAVAAALRPQTRLLWVESPSNPMLRIADLDALSGWARTQGIASVCDNTFATPVLQRPLAYGFDLCLHSTTKYVGGHSDVLGGALVTREVSPLWETVRSLQRRLGAVPGAFDAWLLLRGISTLPLRVHAQSRGAYQLAQALAVHPRVMKVHYPGLAEHPQHSLAARQMKDFGGVVSFEVAGGEADALAVAANVRLLTCATSLGGVESLIEHRASVEGPDTSTPRNLLRVSVGIEHPEDLIADLSRALERQS